MKAKGVVVFEDLVESPNGTTSRRPAALESVANQPIAHHVLDALEAAGVDEVIVACSKRVADQARASLTTRAERVPVKLRLVAQPGAVDLAVGMKLAAPLVDGAPCVVHLANGLLDEALGPMVAQLRPGLPDVILVAHQQPTPDCHLSPATLRMLRIAELDPARAALALAGVWLLGPGAIDHVSAEAPRSEPDVDLTGIGRRIDAAGGRVQVHVADSWRGYSGQARDLLELNRIALDTRQAEPRRPDNHGNSIEGRVWIDERADVRASVIIGPALIGPNTRIHDAYIGPYTSVGSGARIEGAEIERSIICSGASIMHVGGRLVASVVGQDARIFRDFSLPRALRLRVGDGTEVALC